MPDDPEIEVIRGIFADAIAQVFAHKLELHTVARPGAVPAATAIHCQWRLAKDGPPSREITVQVAAAAMDRFRNADARVRDEMLRRVLHTIAIRLSEGRYDEKDSRADAFVVSIDEHSIEP
jgi:hypothetical protein